MAEETRQQQGESRLELLPVELQLEVLERISTYRDLTSLIMSSRPYFATFLKYKKGILARLAQAILGDSFIDACILQLWEGHLNRSSQEDETKQGKSNGFDGRNRLARHPRQWLPGPYRHIQLKFIHDWTQYAMASPGEQIKLMQGLLTAEDLLKVLSHEAANMWRVTSHTAKQFAIRDVANKGGWWPRACPDKVTTASGRRRGGGQRSVVVGTMAGAYSGGGFDATEAQRIMKMIYQHRVLSVLYKPLGEDTTLSQDLTTMVWLDFYEHMDGTQCQEARQCCWKIMAIKGSLIEPWDRAALAVWLPCWADLDGVIREGYETVYVLF